MEFSFTKIEYLVSFTSIIYGFTAAEYIHGWGSLLIHRKLDKGFILWTIMGMLLMVDVWWGSWQRVNIIELGIHYFFLTQTTPILLYLVAVITFPNRAQLRVTNLNDYLKERFSKLMLLYVLALTTILFNNYFVHQVIQLQYWRPEIYLELAGVGICLLGVFINRRYMMNIVLLIGYILIISHIVLYSGTEHFTPPDHYSQNEYLVIFIAILFGYVASVFFSGWGQLIRNFKLSQVHIYHLFWTIFAFLLLLDIWWSTWKKLETIPEGIGYFYLLLLQPITYYILATILFAVLRHKKDKLAKGFKQASPAIFFLFCLNLLFNIVLSTVFNEIPLTDTKNIYRLLGIVFGSIGIFTQNRLYQLIMLFAAYLLYILHLLTDEFGVTIF